MMAMQMFSANVSLTRSFRNQANMLIWCSRTFLIIINV